MIRNGMRPVHPGEVLREDDLKPLKLSANALSKALHVPAGRVNDIVLERRGVTPDRRFGWLVFLAATRGRGSICSKCMT